MIIIVSYFTYVPRKICFASRRCGFLTLVKDPTGTRSFGPDDGMYRPAGSMHLGREVTVCRPLDWRRRSPPLPLSTQYLTQPPSKCFETLLDVSATVQRE
jgi:hypothetical protein